MSKLVIHSETLKEFVDKFFVEMDFSTLQDYKDDETMEVLSNIEKTLVEILEAKYEDEDPVLWFNRELCLRGLVILTQLEHFSEILTRLGYMDRGLILLNRVVESFNKKVLEDPEIVKAIQENRLDEELEKHFPTEVLNNNRMTSTFVELIDEKDLNKIPDQYQPIPEDF
jgi:hypothetical protein